MTHAHGPAHSWDQRYSGSENLFPPHPDEALVGFAAGLPTGRALDLGAGEGRNSLWLARRGWKVTAVDLSAVALGRLAAAAAEEHLAVRTVVTDMKKYLARGERFDLVVMANIHPAPAERAALMEAAAAAVGPGGHLFLVGHHLASLGRAGPPDPERLYVEDDLKDAFPGLEVLCLERRSRQVGDGAAPLYDLVAWAARSLQKEDL
jgi:SAM-dependent methyltransferase